MLSAVECSLEITNAWRQPPKSGPRAVFSVWILTCLWLSGCYRSEVKSKSIGAADPYQSAANHLGAVCGTSGGAAPPGGRLRTLQKQDMTLQKNSQTKPEEKKKKKSDEWVWIIPGDCWSGFLSTYHFVFPLSPPVLEAFTWEHSALLFLIWRKPSFHVLIWSQNSSAKEVLATGVKQEMMAQIGACELNIHVF